MNVMKNQNTVTKYSNVIHSFIIRCVSPLICFIDPNLVPENDSMIFLQKGCRRERGFSIDRGNSNITKRKNNQFLETYLP